jgi:hypothetical protein
MFSLTVEETNVIKSLRLAAIQHKNKINKIKLKSTIYSTCEHPGILGPLVEKLRST